MRRLLAALVLAAALTGCGGGEVSFVEVKSAPPVLPIPKDTGTPVAETSRSPTPTPTPTVTPAAGGSTTAPSSSSATTTTPPSSSSSTDTTTTPPADTGTGATGGTTPTTPTQPSPPSSSTGGATAGQSTDQFCADNPGACND